jgi:hypothetical protein
MVAEFCLHLKLVILISFILWFRCRARMKQLDFNVFPSPYLRVMILIDNPDYDQTITVTHISDDSSVLRSLHIIKVEVE